MSTAVLPFFKLTGLIYRCRTCAWSYSPSRLATTRDQRMIALARHLVEAHDVGPLAVPA